MEYDSTLPPNTITIRLSGDLLVQINADGSMEFGPNYTPDAAAMAFWEAIMSHHPLRNTL